jgi:MoaA/NifB/PqqE/SkfB family radical SAM enzyme
MVQVIKPKPAGGWLEGGASPFTPEDVELVKEKVHRYNQHRDYRHVPAISAQILEEDRDMFGCTAGGTDRFYINAKGDVQPCEFLNISFGNIADEPFADIYQRMRAEFLEPGDCMLCEKYSGKIAGVYKALGLKSLPLDNTQSRAIYRNWHRGAPTPLYAIIEKEMNPTGRHG